MKMILASDFGFGGIDIPYDKSFMTDALKEPCDTATFLKRSTKDRAVASLRIYRKPSPVIIGGRFLGEVKRIVFTECEEIKYLIIKLSSGHMAIIMSNDKRFSVKIIPKILIPSLSVYVGVYLSEHYPA